MGNKNSKKKNAKYSEEEKANRLIKYVCIALALLAIVMMVVYSIV